MYRIPFINVPKETVIKLVPDVYFCKEERAVFDLPHKTFHFTEVLNSPILGPKKKSYLAINNIPLAVKQPFLQKKKSFLALDSIEHDENDKSQLLMESL
jgi:hypothetical protein